MKVSLDLVLMSLSLCLPSLSLSIITAVPGSARVGNLAWMSTFQRWTQKLMEGEPMGIPSGKSRVVSS